MFLADLANKKTQNHDTARNLSAFKTKRFCITACEIFHQNNLFAHIPACVHTCKCNHIYTTHTDKLSHTHKHSHTQIHRELTPEDREEVV